MKQLQFKMNCEKTILTQFIIWTEKQAALFHIHLNFSLSHLFR